MLDDGLAGSIDDTSTGVTALSGYRYGTVVGDVNEDGMADLLLARSFGWHGHHCTRSRELRATLETAFSEPGPSLVVIPIDYRENPLLTKRLGEINSRL